MDSVVFQGGGCFLEVVGSINVLWDRQVCVCLLFRAAPITLCRAFLSAAGLVPHQDVIRLDTFLQSSGGRTAAHVETGLSFAKLSGSKDSAVPSWTDTLCCMSMWGPVTYVCPGTWRLTSLHTFPGWWSFFFFQKSIIMSSVFFRLFASHQSISLWTLSATLTMTAVLWLYKDPRTRPCGAPVPLVEKWLVKLADVINGCFFY